MSKQLIFVLGVPYSGRSTWINKNLYNTNEPMIVIDANSYDKLYVKLDPKDTNEKINDDAIEESRLWCLEEVKSCMTKEIPIEKIILTLIACRPDRWREFIELAIEHEYEIIFKYPKNKYLFYITNHSTFKEQFKFIESKILYRYPKDKKEVLKKSGSKNSQDIVLKEINESSLLKYVITEYESAYAFYLTNKKILDSDNTKWLNKINEQYKTVILNNIKKNEKKIEKEKIKLKEEEEEKETELKLDKEETELELDKEEKVIKHQEQLELDKEEKVLEKEE